MNTKNELRELDDDELSTVQGGMSCAAGAHINEVTIEVREPINWVDLARSYLGL
jgi:hypothetical protein